MPAIKISSLELDSGVIVVKPLRGNSEIVRSEKKYDRHGFGEVVIGGKGVIELDDRKAVPKDENPLKFRSRSANKGDLVVYDDSNAIEVPLDMEDESSPVMVEFINKSDVLAIDRRIVVLKEEK